MVGAAHAMRLGMERETEISRSGGTTDQPKSATIQTERGASGGLQRIVLAPEIQRDGSVSPQRTRRVPPAFADS